MNHISLPHNPEFFERHPVALSILELVQILPEVIFFAKNRSSEFIAVNHAMMAAQRFTEASEIIGKSDHDLHPPALAAAYIAEDQEVMKTGRPIANQIWFVLSAGKMPGWFRCSKVPIMDHGGEVIGIAGLRYSIQSFEEMSNEFKRLAPVIEHMETHYDTTPATADLAAMAGVSVTQFNRRFAQILKMSPHQFLQSLRVEHARLQLSRTDDPISDIALRTGFYDQSHFHRQFKKRTGLTPRAYRMRFRTSS